MNISSQSLPKHVAVIMDGNGRWAKKHFFPRTSGHKAAIKNVRSAIEFAVEKNIEILTLFAFGRENWQRPKQEVATLMELFSEVLVKEIPMMQENNVKLCVVGDRSRLASDILANILQAEHATKLNTGLILNVAIDYSGQWEIVLATKKLLKAIISNQCDVEQLSEECFEKFLIDSIQTPVDLLIRTSGELRISNFMIWQLSYAELYFCQKYWPDFTKKDFQRALDDYQLRKRRFGKTDEQVKGET
ncbi:polyprenyl diphosphate synthase [Fastidiosibacter lacustris]|uniref:polyprenyl diphosphate synthase n=1 Tax=Fastidiosibacter lacustris TaxID=2056695 RepID=UPI001EFC48D4|nr:polyprenyl diphosphate synthase [Fastidiosibacter lacustris]